MTELNETNDGLWSPLGEQRWRELAEGTGASDLQIRFSAARFSGASASKAAALAGYSGDKDSIRRAGYTALRSTAVQNLLELAAINAPGDAKISDREIDAKISRLIRSGDPNVVLKAAELHAKREAARKDAGVQEEELPPGLALARETQALLGCDLGGLLSTAAFHLAIINKYGPRLSYAALPLFRELAPNYKSEFPEIWDRVLAALDDDCRREAEQFALGPLADIKALTPKPEPARVEA
jgi:hypothetical protein